MRGLLLPAAAALLLTGCAALPGEAEQAVDADGTIPVGSFLRVTPAPAPLKLYDSKDALAADGLYYASWSVGESTAYTNEDGETVDLYEAQATMLASEQKTAEGAEASVQSWQSAATDHYDINGSRTETIAGQDYEIISYTMKNSQGPWAEGVSAFAVHGTAAVCVELTCQETFEGDADRLLTDLLGCFVYTDE